MGMTFLLPTLSVAFAAVCVWLTVRIVNRRERWAKWTLAAAMVPVLYVASFGPACWLADWRDGLSDDDIVRDAKAIGIAYRPLARIILLIPDDGVTWNAIVGSGEFGATSGYSISAMSVAHAIDPYITIPEIPSR